MFCWMRRASLSATPWPIALSFAGLYARTGIQKQPFNTVYQLLALQKEHPEQLAAARHFVMIPEYFNYLLTGCIRNEYTNATSTALVNAHTRDWDEEVLAALGLPRAIFGALHLPGTLVGGFTDAVRKAVGFGCTVLLPATHDTGSAFLAVPARDEHAVYLSSGTWSLLGTENAEPVTGEASMRANFTNEGGYAYRYRYLKNIMGLWMIQSIRRELNGAVYVAGRERRAAAEKQWSYAELEAEARRCAGFSSRVEVNDARFLAPESMTQAVKDFCAETRQAVPQTVGGGSQDGYLNELTAKATGLPVYAGPTEGTALGNLMAQWIASGEFADLASARAAIQNSFTIKEATP